MRKFNERIYFHGLIYYNKQILLDVFFVGKPVIIVFNQQEILKSGLISNIQIFTFNAATCVVLLIATELG